MAISKILTDSSASVAAPATLNVTKPTGGTPGANDLLILVVNGGRTAGVCGSYTAPTGWTLVGELLDQANVNNHLSLQVWQAAGDVTSLGFTEAGTVDGLGWVMVCFTGADASAPVDATGTPNSNVVGAASLTTNAVTIATDQAWHLIAFGDWSSGTYTATGFTVAASPTTFEGSGLLYNTTPKSVGSTGTVVVNDSGSTSGQVLVAVPFALRPGGVPVPTGGWDPILTSILPKLGAR